MQRPLRKRLFIYLSVAMTLFIAVQLSIYAYIEYTGWKHHPAEPLREEMEEVLDALSLNLILLPVLILLIHYFSKRLVLPLNKIASTASRIVSGKFSERIDVSELQDAELTELATALNRAFDHYDSAVKRITRFSSDASHQLRMPITSVKAIGEVALSKSRSMDEYRDTVASMLSELDRLSLIVDQLLQLSRLEPGLLQAGMKRHDCTALINNAVQIYSVLCEEKNISLKMLETPGLAVMAIDTLITELVANLLDNAIRHTPENGSIAIGTLKRGSQAVIFVHDDGPGIKAEYAKNIFERFSQIPDAPRGRTGLGLAIAYEIAAAHKGTIELANPDQHGARIEVALPLASPDPDE